MTISGRDISAYLMTSTALQGSRATVRHDARARLAALVRCEVLALKTPGGPSAAAIATALRMPEDRVGEVGAFDRRAPLPAGRSAIAELLGPLRLPPAAVAMVGVGQLERDWSEAARLAAFLPAPRWFGKV